MRKRGEKLRLKKDELTDLLKWTEKQVDSLLQNGYGDDIEERGDMSLFSGNMSLKEQLICMRGIEIGLNWAMGIKNQVVNDEHLAAVAVINVLKEAGITDPVKEIQDLKNQIAENEKSTFNALMTETYGAPHTEEKPNLLRQYAENQLRGKTGKEVNSGIEDLKKDPIALKFAAEKADQDSETNNLGRLENKEENKTESIVMDYS